MRNGPGWGSAGAATAAGPVVEGADGSGPPDREQPVRATAAMRAPASGIRQFTEPFMCDIRESLINRVLHRLPAAEPACGEGAAVPRPCATRVAAAAGPGRK